jgi:hypothetical protein
VAVIRIRNGRVTGIGDRRPGATEFQVSIDGEDGEVDAISYDQLTGPVAVGDPGVVNTTPGGRRGGPRRVPGVLAPGGGPGGAPRPPRT